MPRLPLSDIKVVDITSVIAGPVCGKLLAQMGADVIHIEPPWGDDGRNSTSPFMGREGGTFVASNQGKRGICVDLRKDEGREIVCRMAKNSDVLVHNLTAGGEQRMGVGYEVISSVNPTIVYGWINGYGSRGPLRDLPGYDIVMEALTGHVVRPHGEGLPVLGGVVADPAAPLLLTYGIMAALRERDRTGRGQKVESSLLQGALHMQGSSMCIPRDAPPEERSPQPMRAGGNDPTSRIFQAADGPILVSAYNNKQFALLANLVGKGQLADDPTLASRELREKRYDDLAAIFEPIFTAKPVLEWLDILNGVGIPCSPVSPTVSALAGHQQLWDNDMLVEVEHPTKGTLVQTGVLVSLSETPGRVARAAPLQGQHTDEVLEDLGYTPAEVRTLEEDSVIFRAEV